VVTLISSVLSNAQAARREAAAETRAAEKEASAELRAAAIRAKEKAEDYARQDEVARRAEEAAAQVAKVAIDAQSTAKLLLQSQVETTARQDIVAEKVATAATQAASAADLLLKSQTEAALRQDEVAVRVATAATQAASAAELLRAAQESSAKRQDEVALRVESAAKQAADAAELLRVAQAESITRTDEVARLAAASDTRVQQQLIEIGEMGKLNAEQVNKIHTLVNSEMTAARTAERDAMKLLVVSLKLVIAANKKLGVAVSPDLAEQVDVAEKRVVSLDRLLKERAEAQAKVDAENTSATSEKKP